MPLTDTIKDEIRAHLRKLHDQPGVTPRRGQNRMIAEVARTLSGDTGRRVICVEGPTGTGKSVAYLIPALAIARAEGKSLIIATATVALQEQLALRDIPMLAATLGLDIEAVIAKGRGRYLCPRNLLQVAAVDPSQDALDLGPDASPTMHFDRPLAEAERVQLGRLATAWQNAAFAGDLDQWPEPLTPILVNAVTTSRHGCSGRSCPVYNRCPAQLARRASREADVVVTNHAQLLTEAAFDASVALPALADSILVIDEAHHLPDSAVASAATELPLTSAQRWLRQMGVALSRTLRALPGDAVPLELPSDMSLAIEALRDGIEKINGTIEYRIPSTPVAPKGRRKTGPSSAPKEDTTHTYLTGLDPDLRTSADEILIRAHEITKGLATLKRTWTRLAREGKATESQAAAQVAALAASAERAEQIHKLLELWARPPAMPGPPIAYWVTRTASGRDAQWTACASPIEAAHLLRASIIDAAHGVVLTSATLTAMGRFDMFRGKAGLDENDGTQYLRLESPFNLTAQGELLVPRTAVDPADGWAHTSALITEIESHPAASGGLLVLFTSRAQMEAVYRGLQPEVRAAVERQGEGARAALLRRHGERVARRELAILFGVNSFAEGLDLPGRLCTGVLIARLPFAVPDNPVEAVRKAWMETHGRNYFTEVAIPACALRLTQACGRLIRSEQDVGRITVMDRRLVSTRYGRDILRTLPHFRFTDASMLAGAA